jgi:hypothetical protein
VVAMIKRQYLNQPMTEFPSPFFKGGKGISGDVGQNAMSPDSAVRYSRPMVLETSALFLRPRLSGEQWLCQWLVKKH